MTHRPIWRWLLFCAAFEAFCVFRWRWLSNLWAWCILPEWVHDGSPIDTSGEEPF